MNIPIPSYFQTSAPCLLILAPVKQPWNAGTMMSMKISAKHSHMADVWGMRTILRPRDNVTRNVAHHRKVSMPINVVVAVIRVVFYTNGRQMNSSSVSSSISSSCSSSLSFVVVIIIIVVVVIIIIIIDRIVICVSVRRIKVICQPKLANRNTIFHNHSTPSW